ncbi:TetR/AcrR family transcriptional regulator [Microbacterium sp. CIAB417]|uniref:TetR/AcrR family transcriptional regulator n=1 Tax=Microbacterium sp. CIAB417 TaxID=2860287 RepID=UPI001FAC7AF9|nr:TetR family transcriptional regulator [Microbacterium sp. CIAB417]
MADRPASRSRRSRAERQQETRQALILAALDAFSRDGYHATSLEGIANEAGFSKGAVYSNFSGKPDLFLALMEFNLTMLRDSDWDPLSSDEQVSTSASGTRTESGVEIADMVRGFGLATLEFIATAARDEKLVPALRERVQMMIDAYARVVTEARSEDESLPADDIARLMTALDQGVTILALSGITSLDPGIVRAGMRRLMDPDAAAREPAPERRDSAPFPGVEQVRRLFD